MSRAVYTFNQYHLGDNLIFLHLLRSLAKAHVSTPFVHFCHAHLIPQLAEAVNDLPNILLEPFESELWKLHQHEAIDTWKNAEGFWERSANRWNWSAHTLEHHEWTAQRMGYSSPFTCREHLLFDYPTLSGSPTCGLFEYDFLIGDSQPSSGQYSEWADHAKEPLKPLVEALRSAGHILSTTTELKESGLTISQIGKASVQYCNHIMVPNGPFWATLNTTNRHHHEGRRRIVLLDNGENLSMPFIEQCRNVNEVMEIAKQQAWI